MLEMRGDGGEVLQRLHGLLAALRVPRAQRRREDLLQQTGLAVGRGLEDAQVAPRDAETRELRTRSYDFSLGVVVLGRRALGPAADDPEVLELGHQRARRAG